MSRRHTWEQILLKESLEYLNVLAMTIKCEIEGTKVAEKTKEYEQLLPPKPTWKTIAATENWKLEKLTPSFNHYKNTYTKRQLKHDWESDWNVTVDELWLFRSNHYVFSLLTPMRRIKSGNNTRMVKAEETAFGGLFSGWRNMCYRERRLKIVNKS